MANIRSKRNHLGQIITLFGATYARSYAGSLNHGPLTATASRAPLTRIREIMKEHRTNRNSSKFPRVAGVCLLQPEADN